MPVANCLDTCYCMQAILGSDTNIFACFSYTNERSEKHEDDHHRHISYLTCKHCLDKCTNKTNILQHLFLNTHYVHKREILSILIHGEKKKNLFIYINE
jgi:hypothetical protein